MQTKPQSFGGHPRDLFDLFALPMLNKTQIYLLDRIQTSEADGQPYRDTSPYKVCGYSLELIYRPWLWSSGYRACLLLQWSVF